MFLVSRTGDVLAKICEKELHFVEQCLRMNPKCYSSWHQRCWIMDKMEAPDWKRELDLCNKYLEYDERNCKKHSCNTLSQVLASPYRPIFLVFLF